MDVVSVLRQAMSEEPEIELAVLFGSHASGRATAESDVDLGIRWAEGVTPPERNEVLDRLERAVHASIDATVLDEAPPLLRMEIARSGAVVRAVEPGCWPAFCARAMLDWWDFAPYAKRMHDAARARLEAKARGAR
ncbi:MAG: nucleotidyltransferase domain-containing protein [Myxococcales bacterium]|nr:nucleotidyltransferase domain-containing protein [Myxococcales bacterium]